MQDLRYAWRMLRKNLGLSVVIVLSLAIGIGANSAIFSVVDALLLRPLPYPQADRLAAIWLHSPGIGIFRDWPSPGQYVDICNENHSFDETAIAQGRDMTLTGRGEPVRVSVLKTSSSLLRMMGVKPLLGRGLVPADDAPGRPAVAVLSYGLWTRLFGGDPQIVGRGINLNDTAYTVAGVLPRDFLLNAEILPSEGPMDNLDAIVPLPLGADAVRRRGDENYNIVVRLKPGVSVAQAQADIDMIAGRIRVKDKRDRTFGMTVIGLLDQVVGDVRRTLLVLMGSVGLVLLIACANVANLLLTRAAGRQKEIAIRTALGAGGGRLIRQLLSEAVLLSLLGGAAGLALAEACLYVVRAINPGNIPRLYDIGISGTVVAFTFAVSVVTGILFGLAPAWRARNVDLNTTLKAGGRSAQGDGGLRLSRNRLRGLLVVSEVAISVVLLVGAGLLVRSYARLQDVNPGFARDHVLTMAVALTGTGYHQNDAVRAFYREAAVRIRRLPGVIAEGVASTVPLSGAIGWGGINVEGYTPPPGSELQVDLRLAGTDYFRAMEIPLIAGRFFEERDADKAPQVAIIDRKFADRFWPHGDAVGKHIWFDVKKPMEIVGVVGTVKQYGLAEDGKIVAYFPHEQNPSRGMYMAVRTSGDAAAMAGPVVREIHAIDAAVPVYEIRTIGQRLHDSLARQRFSTTMLGAFAAFALLLAAVGVYGVISFLVTESTHDIGVRLALGASPPSIVRLVVRQGMELAAMGIGAGLVGAAALTGLMASLLFGVKARDGITFAGVVAVLAVAALAACAIPALRAARVDPMAALRDE
jgi:predicted permease